MEDDVQGSVIPTYTSPLALERLRNRGSRDIQWILQPFAEHDVIFKNYFVVLTKIVLMRLNGDWLNDDIIDFYLHMVQRRHVKQRELNPLFAFAILTSHFMELLQDCGTGLRRDSLGYNYARVKNITRTFNSFELNSIFIPVNINNYHWTFVHIDMILKKILYYDSLNGSGHAQKHFTLSRWWLTDEAAKHGQVLDLAAWSDECVQGGPTQSNSLDCGVYVIKGIEQLTKGLPLDYSSADIIFLFLLYFLYIKSYLRLQ